MEVIFSWFKVNFPEHELVYYYDSEAATHVFRIARTDIIDVLMYSIHITMNELMCFASEDERIEVVKKRIRDAIAQVEE